MPTIIIVWHSRTGASAALAEAAEAGARSAEIAKMLCVESDMVKPGNLLEADGVIFIGPENLGALSGAMKEMLDRCYYDVIGKVEGRPYAHIVAAGSDGSGAARQLERIVTGWRLKAIAPPLIVNLKADTPEAILAAKQVSAGDLARAREIGATLAHGLEIGLF
jgi:multimeric flavodoxin WrbA